MGTLAAVLKHPEDLPVLVKMMMATNRAVKQIPSQPHWAFCYTMLTKVSRSFALVIQQLGPQLRDAVCVFYLVLRALDTVEDDTSIPSDVKVPILKSFHSHMYDPTWHFSCGTKHYKVLMDQFHLVSTAFLELGKSYQEAIEDITKRMGAGMAKFICMECNDLKEKRSEGFQNLKVQETQNFPPPNLINVSSFKLPLASVCCTVLHYLVETVDDYDEYCHYVAGLVGLGLSKLFHASGSEDLAPADLSNSMGLFLQKTNIIRDYLEDINEIPKSRMFWPREIWSKYVDKLEDLKHEENSVLVVKCLNEMVNNALTHIEDCLEYMTSLRDPAIFRFCAIPQVMAIGTLALCYNNIHVFRGVVKMRRGLVAKVVDQTNKISDVYGAFFYFTSLLQSKVDKNDPNSLKTIEITEKVQTLCRATGVLRERRIYTDEGKSNQSVVFMVVIALLSILIAYLNSK